MSAAVARFVDLSLVAQTAYAELLDSSRAQLLQRSIANLTGSFAIKKVKNRTYWYYQYRDLDGRVRQLYVGPDTDAVRALASSARARRTGALEPLARSALALGCARILPKHFRIVRRLAEYGFFHAGGMLVGTHAFVAHGNLLGVQWLEGARTQDVDFAHPGRNLAIALPSLMHVDVERAIDSLAMGFLPMTALSSGSDATFVNPNDPGLRIDFLTTRHRGQGSTVFVPNLNVALQPLAFMEYLLESPAQAAIFCAEGSVVVNVPSPARFALHKLLVWAERGAAFRVKAAKDLAQAAALVAVFVHHGREDELGEAWADLLARGPGWRKRATKAVKALARLAPELGVEELLRTEAH